MWCAMPTDLTTLMQKMSVPPADPRLESLGDAVFAQIHQRRRERVVRRQTVALQLVCIFVAFAAGWMRAEASVPRELLPVAEVSAPAADTVP